MIRPAPFPTPRPASRPPAAHVIIDAYANDECGRWGVLIVEPDGSPTMRLGDVSTEGATKENLAEAGWHCFEEALREADERGTISLDIRCQFLRTHAAGLTVMLPKVQLFVGDNASSYRQILRDAVQQGLLAISEKVEDSASEQPQENRDHRKLTVLIDADASVNLFRGVAGLGWVVSDPTDGKVLSYGLQSRKVPVGDNNLAELAAIFHAVLHTYEIMPETRAGIYRVQSDSQTAIRLINEATGEIGQRRHTVAQLNMAKSIVKFCGRRNIKLELQWVKGHDGHAHNEAADRLAVMARRNREFGVTSEVRTKMIEKAAQDIVRLIAS